MLDKLLNFLEDKKILILGVGIEGKSTYDFLRRNFPEKQLYISDKKTNLLEKYAEFLEDINLELSMGENYLNGIEQYDLIIKTPGISFKNMNIAAFQNKITSQLQLLLEFVDVFTIGITGTKGKSTTSSLIYQILKEQNKKTFLLGNIGEPIFDKMEELEKDSVVVLELSSHALQYVKKSPNIAVLLNLYQEHLDFYSSFEEYANSKFNVTKFQKRGDFLIYNADNERIQKYSVKKTDYAVTLKEVTNQENVVYIKENCIYCKDRCMMNLEIPLKLKGMHNINNIMFALAICDMMNLNLGKAVDTIQNFEALEHRMEFVGEVGAVEYYNDSIATIPEATINTIQALKKVNTIIVGGKDRGVNQNELQDFLKKSEVENIVCLPKTGEFIYHALKNIKSKRLFMVENLQEAVKIAKRVTRKNTICVLSPAASSYGYFRDFKERGNQFKEIVLEDIKNNEIKI